MRTTSMPHLNSTSIVGRSAALLLFLLPGCLAIPNKTSTPPQQTTNSASQSGGSTVQPVSRDRSKLTPIPRPPAPRASGKARPSEAAREAQLQVLPWAGFKAAITYTFDDTQPSQAEHLPELLATNARLTFFANPSGNWQSNFDTTWKAVAAAGHEIGNHTYNHCHADFSDQNCKATGTPDDELVRTNSYFAEHFGVAETYSFAAPYGDTGWNQYAQARFLVGRGVRGGFVAPTGTADWYDLPAIAVTGGQTDRDFNASIDSAYAQGGWGLFLFHSMLPSKDNWYAGVEVRHVTASIRYAQSLDGMWIDSMVAIGAYARAQQFFEGLRPSNDVWAWTVPAHFPAGVVLRLTTKGGCLYQDGRELTWDPHGYYEVSIDAGNLSWKA